VTSYSQFGEDLHIAEIFTSDGVLKSDGLLLDIGAWGVRDLSNSRLFIEAGWSAVLIEFSPMPTHGLVAEYGYNERVHVIQAAITPGPEHVQQFEITQDALSTNDPAHLAQWKNSDSSGQEGPNRGGYYGRLWVPTLSVHALLSQFFGARSIDFVSVDTEGTSVAVAIALMKTDHRPRVLVVEHDGKLTYLQEQAQEWGYHTIWTNGTNVILCR
jgi:hypothetical protein